MRERLPHESHEAWKARITSPAPQAPWVTVEEFDRIEYTLGGDPGGLGVRIEDRDQVLAAVRWLREDVARAVGDSPGEQARAEMEWLLLDGALEENDAGDMDRWTVYLLAWSRRFDVAGYDHAWAPEGVTVDA